MHKTTYRIDKKFYRYIYIWCDVMETNKRIVWIDILKYFCIFFVMLSHLDDSKLAPQLRQFYVPFFLTSFLFASGYVYKNRNNFKEHLLRKTKQLLIPWFMFSTVNIVLSQILTFNPHKHNGFISDMAKNLLQVRGYNEGMWFVSALFIAYIPFYFFVKSYEENKKQNEKVYIKYLFICFILFLINETYIALMPKEFFPWKLNGLPWHIEYIPFAICFMFCGYLFRERCEPLFDKINLKKYIIIILFIYLIIVYVPYMLNINFFWLANILYDFVKACLGIFLIIIISKSIKENKYMCFVGQNTLIYFGIHCKVLSLTEKIFKTFMPSVYISVYTNPLLSAIYSLMFGLMISVVLIIPTIIINKYFPFMMGKWYKKSQQK